MSIVFYASSAICFLETDSETQLVADAEGKLVKKNKFSAIWIILHFLKKQAEQPSSALGRKDKFSMKVLTFSFTKNSRSFY